MAPFGHQRGSSRAYTLVTQSSAASARLPLDRSEKIQGMFSAVCLKEALPLSSVHWATLQDTLVSIQEVKWSSWGSLKSGISLVMWKGEEQLPEVTMVISWRSRRLLHCLLKTLCLLLLKSRIEVTSTC